MLQKRTILNLGTWGYGLFGNMPNIITQIMNYVNLMYVAFLIIVFYIYDGINYKE